MSETGWSELTMNLKSKRVSRTDDAIRNGRWICTEIAVKTRSYEHLDIWGGGNKYDCTMNKELADAAVYAPGRRCVCTHQMAAQFSAWNDVMAAILKLLWPDVRNPTPRQSMRILHLKNNPAKFHPDPSWDYGALDFFGRGRSNISNKNNQKSSDMRSVSGPIMGKHTTERRWNNCFSPVKVVGGRWGLKMNRERFPMKNVLQTSICNSVIWLSLCVMKKLKETGFVSWSFRHRFFKKHFVTIN